MVHKCSYIKVLEVFFQEPTKIHFIKEISKKINLAPTSVRNNLKKLIEERLIIPKKSQPFDGYIANRDYKEFSFQKRVYNLGSLEKLKNYLERNYFPKLAVVFGSYSIGEDREDSDIDLLVILKNKKIDLEKFEKELKREISVLILDNINKLEKPILNKVYNGFVICGGFDIK